MRKKYVSPLFAELELEDVLYESGDSENVQEDAWKDESFDNEDDFGF